MPPPPKRSLTLMTAPSSCSAASGSAGSPTNLILALAEKGTKNITAISNNIGLGDRLDILCQNKQIRKFIGSFPIRATSQSARPPLGGVSGR